MFISYIFTGWLFLGISLPLVFLFDWSVNAAFALVVVVGVSLFVWIFRMARAIWIHIAIKYNPDHPILK